jgi:hypothetical protein
MQEVSDDHVEATESEQPVEDVEEEETTTPYRFTVTSYGADYPVDGLVKRLQAGDVAIPTFDPEVEPGLDVEGFQRQFVWTKPQCDRFIESLLLGLPVPGIFLVKQTDGRLLVLDGQQRLRTLAAFYRGVLREREFRLENVQKQYQGLSYTGLPVEDRRRLDDGIIHATIVRQDEPSDDQSSIYLVFERLNTGGTTLHPQEIRVALYRGLLIRLLRRLNENTDWRALYGNRSNRLKDQELILRFFGLRFWRHNYEPPMKDFLNRYTAENRDLRLQDEATLTGAFETTIGVIRKSLGPKAFRLKTAVNAAVLDAVMVGVSSRLAGGTPVTDLGSLKAAYDSLLTNLAFRNATGRATAAEEYVRTRVDLAVDAMRSVG